MAKITKIKIKNLYGITEFEADNKSLELLGGNGTGKTSVLDAIRYALTNRSTRDCIVKQGSTEGERTQFFPTFSLFPFPLFPFPLFPFPFSIFPFPLPLSPPPPLHQKKGSERSRVL